jgi:hypothetical protein
MHFYLIYQGPLPASGTRDDKHHIRRALHPQLERLWRMPPLSELSRDLNTPEAKNPFDRQTGKHAFRVLITEAMHLYASLDITVLRSNRPGYVVSGGDIDNHLKTLFDALRYPQIPQEIPTRRAAMPLRGPTYCLLEDDRLIRELSVRVEPLLSPAPPNEAMVVMRVQVKASRATPENLSLVG